MTGREVPAMSMGTRASCSVPEYMNTDIQKAVIGL